MLVPGSKARRCLYPGLVVPSGPAEPAGWLSLPLHAWRPNRHPHSGLRRPADGRALLAGGGGLASGSWRLSPRTGPLNRPQAVRPAHPFRSRSFSGQRPLRRLRRWAGFVRCRARLPRRGAFALQGGCPLDGRALQSGEPSTTGTPDAAVIRPGNWREFSSPEAQFPDAAGPPMSGKCPPAIKGLLERANGTPPPPATLAAAQGSWMQTRTGSPDWRTSSTPALPGLPSTEETQSEISGACLSADPASYATSARFSSQPRRRSSSAETSMVKFTPPNQSFLVRFSNGRGSGRLGKAGELAVGGAQLGVEQFHVLPRTPSWGAR